MTVTIFGTGSDPFLDVSGSGVVNSSDPFNVSLVMSDGDFFTSTGVGVGRTSIDPFRNTVTISTGQVSTGLPTDPFFHGTTPFVTSPFAPSPLVTTDMVTTATPTVVTRVVPNPSGVVRVGSIGNEVIAGTALDDILDGRAGNDALTGGPGRDTLFGGAGNDLLHGGRDDDTLFGGPDQDTLWGDQGNDWLKGGGGADLFAFQPGSGHDVIADFSPIDGDRIGLAAGMGFTVGGDGFGNAVVRMSATDDITLLGIPPSRVDPGWFVPI
ncbi:calcium-binding protein [Azospirillum sp. sgz301742]